ncbi:uncharacterized protein PpBr36_10129 [Pyricularia pennisetigena]|uniref:uncharacterized protein n=1 Tax=Pyricularia pennisetigena TaxID=1578925 RepID=UPI001152494A|nr:uncharacterized protein PpBr36_10129 [Pyricularia pennisetigena]TLS21348.1 hypothetical protein PpBr36_10129 [Pyricularia pennisetigena]
MRNFFAAAFVLLTLTGSGLGLSVSTDATCGGNTDKTCLGSVFGNCCSQYGYCGSTTDHCSGGCQAGFGSCSSSGGGGQPQPTPVLKASSDGTCGGSTGSTCAGSTFGNCCSQYGYCGSTDAHCSGGCQAGFGSCSSGGGGGGGSQPAPVLKASSDGACGGNTGSTCAGMTPIAVRAAKLDSAIVVLASRLELLLLLDLNHKLTQPPSLTSSASLKPVSTSSTDKLPDSTSTPTPTSTPTQLAACLSAANVPAIYPGSSDYNKLAKPYNIRLPFKPAVIVLATTVQHVQTAVNCARDAKIKVQARSGGHSYAAFGLGGQDGSMMVDLQGMQTISVDSKNVAKVGGGVRLGNLANTLYSQGKRAVSHGTCPGVGIGGHFTHGGFGYSSRAWGLALDHITQLEVVTADGKVVMASATQNADLFYAMRGAAESFGIITTFYLRTEAAPTNVVNWAFGFANQFGNPSVGAKTMLRIQDFARNATVINRKIGMGVYLDGETFSFSGTYFGSLADFNSKIKPELLRGMPTPASQSAKSVSWIESLTMLSGKTSIVESTQTGAYDEHDNFLAKSLVVPESSPITTEAMNSFFQTIKDKSAAAGASWYTIFNLYGGPDSQINAVSAASSSYSDRSALWVIQNYGFASQDTNPFPLGTVQTYLSALNSALQLRSTAGFGAYLNYVDPTLSADQAHDLYYGKETYAKLQSIKRAVDPSQVFWNPQAITI